MLETSIPKNSNLTIAYLALIAWLPIPVGSFHLWAISIAEVWCFILVIIAVLHHHHSNTLLPDAFKAAKPTLILFLLYLCWLLFQITPLPIELLTMLSPHAASMYAATDPQISIATISLDVHTTWLKFIEATFLFCMFSLALFLINTRQKVKWLVYTVLITALIQSIYGSLMVLTGMEYSFFVHKSQLNSQIGSATGTFHSRNTFAAYLEIALALGIGYMISLLSIDKNGGNWKQHVKRWTELLLSPKMRLRIILILLCLGLVMSHSRGGNIAFFSSLAVAGALFLIFARKKPRATVIFLISIFILDIVLIGSWVGLSKVMTRLEQTTIQNEVRYDIYIKSIPIIKDYFLTGSGSGTFAQLLPIYKNGTEIGLTYYQFAFNDLIETLTETGFIGFLLLAGVVFSSLIAAIKVLRRQRSSMQHGLAFATLMAISTITIHSMVDYPMQILSTSSAFIIMLALPFVCSNLKNRTKS